MSLSLKSSQDKKDLETKTENIINDLQIERDDFQGEIEELNKQLEQQDEIISKITAEYEKEKAQSTLFAR